MKKQFSLLMLGATALSLCCGCSSHSDAIIYPDYPLTPSDKDSWEYLADDDGKIEEWDLEWYVNDSVFSWNSYGSDRVSKVLKEKTGVNIKFTVPVTDDGQKLSTLIAGNKLPDLVSVQCWYTQCSQLAAQNYLYPLDELIDRWAPSFKTREQTDIWNYFREGDGYTYGVPNFAYSTMYVNDADKMEPNGCLMVREDWYVEAVNAGYPMTSPTSFIEGCKYIANLHTNAIPFQLDSFTSEGNDSIDWLAQYFRSFFEDDEGNYQDTRLSEGYQEMLAFLNQCNKEGIIRASNYSDKAEQVRTNISRGNVFVSAVTPQDYQAAFINCFANGITYVPLVLRNAAGEAPVLQDLSGNGYLLTMVSRNCKRPDKVIKLLDYLYSEEGQRLVAFGVEGESWNWNEDHTEIVWTDRYISGVNGNTEDQAWINTLGIYQMTLLMNLAYINKVKPLNGRRAVDIYIDNMKRPLTPYSYNFKPIFLKHDTGASNYFDVSTKSNKIKTKWAEALVNIIRAADWKSTYDSAVTYAKKQGLQDVIDFYSISYQNTKTLMGVEWGYPTRREGYVAPVTARLKGADNGDFSYWRSTTHSDEFDG